MRVFRSIERLKAFRNRDDGAAMVEFAIILPIFCLAFFTVVEFSRLFFSYQGAVSGVRDAARYMARTQDAFICDDKSNGFQSSWTSYTRASYNTDIENSDPTDAFYAIVWRNMRTEVASALPANIELNRVRYRYFCKAGSGVGLSQPLVPMAEMRATFTVTMPLIGILELNGGPLLPPITRELVDQSRIYGT